MFSDPGGNRIEVFWRPHIAAEPFKPGRPISGFRTGPLGMGHVVLNVENAEPMLGFYRDLLGFRISDFGRTPYKLYFFHLNGRHHSFAMVESGKRSIHHFMIEMVSLDDVGQGYDLAQLEDGRIAYTLGRHTNDHVTSFYSHTPSGFFVEYGWGGLVIDPATWTPHETFDGPSLWGHERLYMEEAQRRRLREMRLDAAARGVRVPDPSPNTVDCAWLNRVKATSLGGRRRKQLFRCRVHAFMIERNTLRGFLHGPEKLIDAFRQRQRLRDPDHSHGTQKRRS